jgi:hypothetical protein
MFTEKLHLNEMLVRYDDKGNLLGAHCAYLEVLEKDGVIYSAQQKAPQSLVVGGTEFNAVIGQVLNDALATLSIRDAEIQRLNAKIARLNDVVASQ